MNTHTPGCDWPADHMGACPERPAYRCNCGQEFPSHLARTAHAASCPSMADVFPASPPHSQAATRQRHYIYWHLDSQSYHPRAEVTCDSDIGANCRLTCGIACGAETYPCGDDDSLHPLIDQGACNAVLFIENDDGVESCYVGPPINSLPAGLITVSWQYDHWGWQYPEVTP